MSMINDALRRASDASATATMPEPGAVPPPLPPLEPISSEIPPLVDDAPKKSALPLIIAVVLLCLGAAAGGFLWQRSRRAASAAKPKPGDIASAIVTKLTPSGKSTKPENTTSVEKPAPSNPAPEPASAVASKAPTAVSTPVATPAKSAPAPVAAAPAAPLPNVTFPPLRLQGIYYRPPNPSVMINGRTLYVNDQVQGVTVASIDQSSVTLVLSGRTNVLTLR